MAQLYLSLLDHAIESVAEALRLLRAEQGRPAEKRSAFRLAGALHQAHLAVEKLLKHAVSRVDPLLLLEDPKPRLLRDVRREMIQKELPSIFASRRYLASSNAEQAWDVLKEVLDPRIDADTRGAFESALKALSVFRNQAQHGELYADDAEVFSALTRVLARTPALAAAVAPEFLAGLEQRHPKQFAEIHAIEHEVSAVWWVIQQRLVKRRKVVVAIAVHVTTRPDAPTLNVNISRFHPAGSSPSLLLYTLGTVAGPSLSLTADVDPEAATGLFARSISADQARERDTARRDIVRQRLASAPQTPVDPSSPPMSPPVADAQPLRPTGGLFGIRPLSSLHGGLLGDALQNAILGASKRAFERQREYIENNGLPPLEDGTLRIASAPAWVQIPYRGDQYISGDIVLESVEFELSRARARGRIAGAVLPPSRDRGDPVTPLKLQGKLWLTDEIVVTEPSTSSTNPLPIGTIIRYFRGEVRLLLGTTSP